MKIDVPLSGDLTGGGTSARELASAGASGAFTFEGPHDAFVPLVLAAAAGAPLDLYTNVAIAFPRSPVHLAHIAYVRSDQFRRDTAAVQALTWEVAHA